MCKLNLCLPFLLSCKSDSHPLLWFLCKWDPYIRVHLHLNTLFWPSFNPEWSWTFSNPKETRPIYWNDLFTHWTSLYSVRLTYSNQIICEMKNPITQLFVRRTSGFFMDILPSNRNFLAMPISSLNNINPINLEIFHSTIRK